MDKLVCWAFVPARVKAAEGSWNKNMAHLNGKPLVDWPVREALKHPDLEQVVVSTNPGTVWNYIGNTHSSAVLHERPENECEPMYPVERTILRYLEGLSAPPDLMMVLQPTSPFVWKTHISEALAKLRKTPSLNSVQTTVEVPHNHHEINHRMVDQGKLHWVHPEARRASYNKELKDTRLAFGNLVVFRVPEALEQGTIWAEPMLGVPIDSLFGIDVDTKNDLLMANALMHYLKAAKEKK